MPLLSISVMMSETGRFATMLAFRSAAFFVNGKAEGEAWQWYRNGNKFKRFNYLAGQPSGLQQAWRKNGKLFFGGISRASEHVNDPLNS